MSSNDHRDGSKYVWNDVDNNLRDLLTLAQSRKVLGDVEVTNTDGAQQKSYWGEQKHVPMWSSYGSHLRYVNSAIEFDDGSLLVCATIATWGGTFQSHDDISVRYYHLEPMDPSPLHRDVRMALKKSP